MKSISQSPKGKKKVSPTPKKASGASLKAAPLKLEVGKYYLNRDGNRRGPLIETPAYQIQYVKTHPFYDPESCDTYRPNGRYGSRDGISGWDLVREVKRPHGRTTK